MIFFMFLIYAARLRLQLVLNELLTRGNQFNPRSLIDSPWSQGADHTLLLFNSDKRLLLRETSVLRETMRPMKYSLPEQTISTNSHTRSKHFQHISMRSVIWCMSPKKKQTNNETTQLRKKNKTSKYTFAHSKTTKIQSLVHHLTRKMFSKEF